MGERGSGRRGGSPSPGPTAPQALPLRPAGVAPELSGPVHSARLLQSAGHGTGTTGPVTGCPGPARGHTGATVPGPVHGAWASSGTDVTQVEAVPADRCHLGPGLRLTPASHQGLGLPRRWLGSDPTSQPRTPRSRGQWSRQGPQACRREGCPPPGGLGVRPHDSVLRTERQAEPTRAAPGKPGHRLRGHSGAGPLQTAWSPVPGESGHPHRRGVHVATSSCPVAPSGWREVPACPPEPGLGCAGKAVWLQESSSPSLGLSQLNWQPPQLM